MKICLLLGKTITIRKAREGKESTKFQIYVSAIVLLYVVTSRYLYKGESIRKDASLCCILIIFHSQLGKTISRLMKNFSVTNNTMLFSHPICHEKQALRDFRASQSRSIFTFVKTPSK